MTVRYRKKLIEVALPLAAINEASGKEKSIRHGHPSTLHLWWARRPLAACRAVLFAQFVDDPSSVPEEFPDEAAQEAERKRLFGIIEQIVPWKNSNDPHVLRDARREIARSVARSRNEAPPEDHDIDTYLASNAPPVVDPFCGGGSIPLEAQRLGLRAHGSDLNPVAVLITKALVEIPPHFAGRPPVNPDSRESIGGSWASQGAHGLAEDVRYYGQWMRDEAEKRIGHLYPKVDVTPEMVRERPDLKAYEGRRLTVIAWIWARTVASSNPAAKGAHVPLVSSFMLSTKRGRKSWVEIVIDPEATSGWRFEARSGPLSQEAEAVAKLGTKAGKAKDFVCCLTGTPIQRTYIQAEGKAGRLAKRLMAVVVPGSKGRSYVSPSKAYEMAANHKQFHTQASQARDTFLSGSTPTRAMITGGVCSAYGLDTWGRLFTDRQIAALTTFSELVSDACALVRRECVAARPISPDDDVSLAKGGNGAQAYADAVATYLSLCVGRASDYWSCNATWVNTGEFIRNTFARQAIPMIWDFAESNPFSSASGNWSDTAVGWVTGVLAALPSAECSGTSRQSDARENLASSASVVATDPPYYDNIGYGDLSDFFYIWLRRSLGTVHPDIFRTLLTPKNAELVATPYRFGGDRDEARRFFETGLGQATSQMRSAHAPDFPMTLFYAYKQSEPVVHEDRGGAQASTGWETMLSGIVQNGFEITGTWPLRTERGARSIAMNTNALASSIVLVCRPRPADAPVASRRNFASALGPELREAIRRMHAEHIAPVDLAQAAIGPGMAVFSRYAQVLEADGEPMQVRGALVEINRVLDETLTEAEGDIDGDTRFCVAWYEQYGMAERPYGEAEVLFTAKNTSFEGLEHAGVLVGGGGKVRLKRRDELETNWDPATDDRIADWECVQHLVRAMTAESGGGVAEAARLATAMGPARAETARNLAYRLHAVSERKGWSAEALAYNVLATSWPQIQSAMAQRGTTQSLLPGMDSIPQQVEN